MEVDVLSKGKVKGKGKKGPVGSGKGNKGKNHKSNVRCWNCGKSSHYASDCREKWSGDKGSGKSKGCQGKKGTGKGKGKGKLNSVENGIWQEGWWNEEDADGWWKDEQAGSGSSAGRWTANDLTSREPEGPVGAIEVNSVEPRCIKHYRWRQEWLMLNYDSGAAVTALLVAVARNLPVEKRV